MLTAVDIINVLRQEELSIGAIGDVYVDVDSIVAGGSSVVARCRIRGVEGDFLLKCLYDTGIPQRWCPRALCVSYLNVATISGRRQKMCCILRHWVDGISLDRAIISGECDYTKFSILFDRMALEQLLSAEAHGDISPENIVVCGDRMRLIDNDAAWSPNDKNQYALEYGTPCFTRPNREIQRPSKHMDDYSIALLSTLLADLSHYAAMNRASEDTRGAIPQEMIEGILSPTHDTIACATRRLLDVGDMPHYALAKTLGGVLTHIPQLRDILEYITTHYHSLL